MRRRRGDADAAGEPACDRQPPGHEGHEKVNVMFGRFPAGRLLSDGLLRGRVPAFQAATVAARVAGATTR